MFLLSERDCTTVISVSVDFYQSKYTINIQHTVVAQDISMWKLSVFLFDIILALTLFSVIVNGEQMEIARERLKIIVAPKSESCFFISKLKEHNILNIRFLVISYKDGKQQDITFRLLDPITHRMLNYQSRKGHGNFSSYEIKKEAEVQVCLNNRHSIVESKTVIWEYDLMGDLAEEHFIADASEEELSLNATLAEWKEQAEKVRRSVIKVRGNVARSKHTQWWLNQKVGG